MAATLKFIDYNVAMTFILIIIIIIIIILNCFKLQALIYEYPEDVKLDGLLRRVMGDAPIGLSPLAIHFSKALVTRNISFSDSVPLSGTV